MRETITEALKTAVKAQDKRRTATLRLVQAAIQDRDIAHRGAGKEPVTGEEIAQILAKMVKQREESARLYDEGNRPDLAAQERDEIEIIRDYLPQQLSDAEVEAATRAVIAEIGASGLRDMGRTMAALKEKFAGKMDFGKASGVVKALLK